jgi:hypothetical protein
MTTRRVIPEPPRPALTDLEAYLLGIIQGRRGSGKAIGQAELSEHAKAPERTVRDALKALIEVHGYPVCTAYAGKRSGYFWPLSTADIEEAIDKLERHGASIMTRKSHLYRALRRMREAALEPTLEVKP